MRLRGILAARRENFEGESVERRNIRFTDLADGVRTCFGGIDRGKKQTN